MNKLSYLAVITLIAFTSILPLCPETQAIVRESWSQRYFSLIREDDVTCGVATDSLGNIYVAGQFGSSVAIMEDYALMKLAPNGAQQWIVCYDGGANEPDIPVDFIRDHSGNFYLTGRSQGIDNLEIATVKYNSEGILQWVTHYPLHDWTDQGPAAMALDADGNVYVTGGWLGYGLDGDIVTIKYSATGDTLWYAHFNDLGDYAEDIAVDGQGNVYVAGMSTIGWPSADMVIIKYNSQGVQEWVDRYNGPGNGYDFPNSLKLDAQANVYVTGASMGIGTTNYDIATIKYNSAGVLQWVVRYDTPNHADDRAADIQIDADGNLVVAGWTEEPNVNFAYITLKYSSDGAELWSRIYYQGGSNGNMSGTGALVVDANRNIYVTGSVSVAQFWNISESLTLKYDSNGNQKWAARHIEDETSWGGGTWGRYMTLDQQDNVIVGGDFCFGGDIIDRDFWVAKYQQTTTDLSVTMLPAVTPVQIPAQGGSFSYEEQTINPVVDNLRVDNWWKVIYPNQTTTRVLGPVEDRLQLGNQSTERSQRVPGNAPAGVYQYVMNIGEYPGIIWAADTLSFTKLGNGVGAGVDDWGISKENGGTRSVVSSSPGQFGLLGVSPNPFNPTTTIRFTLPEAARVALEVFDINGHCVSGSGTTPTTGFYPVGSNEIIFDGSGLASGVYVYHLTTGDATLTGKMILMK